MRILVIEDEKKIANFVKRGLKEEGYAVDVAGDGEDGYSLITINFNEYDLIILDVMIPKIDGFSLCKKLREEKINIPILMLTGKDDVTDKVKGLNSGADDYLTKPFAFEELLARVRAILRMRGAHKVTKLEVGDIILDLLTHKVTRANKEIILTTKEFSLLEYLMRNAGNVVTRTMISEHVWDVNFDTFTNVIDVYITYLRKKIDGGFSKKMLNTIRGRGYILKK
ncbi:MAG: DNA-binding response regulator [Elusimicrobia bacterium RIFOXYC2_FULL_34_12]|nr:MAG: DNA-binding response regulator [Elusimicrobia bacterium RIFOXYC2_FULL_34_12]OGS39516.1 MAG: DNA-binding response regulator [Elusimicrobia bacterium RIFOXYD2_FULL_34_30]HAM39465.1 DNA-binding response regulator [Elusimicrobiota bacterium]